MSSAANGASDERRTGGSEERRGGGRGDERRRAQAAEKALSELQAELSASETKLEERAQELEMLRRQQRIDELLIEANAVDIEAARLLVELSVVDQDEPDVADAVSDLRRRKPFLFHVRAGGSGVLSPREGESAAQHGRLERAATEASGSGKRQDLLQYLRLRRRQ